MPRGGRTLLVFLACVALHYTLRPLLGWRVTPQFLVIAVLLMAVRVRPGVAAVLGFAVGLVADSLAPATFGAGALGFTLIGFCASWLKAVFFSDNAFLHAFFFFTGTWAFELVVLLAARRGTPLDLVASALLWAPLEAGVTALAGVGVLLVGRSILEAPPA